MAAIAFSLIAVGSSLSEDHADTAEGIEAAPIVAEAEHSLNDARAADKQRKAMAALLALCGILIGGLMFVAVVMIWGARLRRQARRELPPQNTLQNTLWFLKPPKPPPE